ncbi:hypothetical protein EG329_002070 [Mollisiaceae sp. DMI_Dod_QoI]|nr:hypothetical protein EG329_002070 [Helotiales sp. DMI_Dod_QoI]
MRLIDVRTCKLKSFDANPPPYAILSHRWGKDEDEVSFQDFQDIANREEIKGFHKILAMCDQAKQDSIYYAWVDTCCIDKSSSAELSEAINSMFKWYRNSKICYAYLGDATPQDWTSSDWFKRGWTLQELIAPVKMEFYCGSNAKWDYLGSKKELADDISKVTKVNSKLLQGRAYLGWFSVAKRMSWAAKRETKREEDLAYCLLGLFGVNMPLLYGEGSNAFIRLQEEIIKKLDDQTIFAWQDRSNLPYRGMFATSPSAFALSEDLVPLRNITIDNHIEVTARGLRTNTIVCLTQEIEEQLALQVSTSYLFLPLNCTSRKSSDGEDIFDAILLVWRGGNKYWRAKPEALFQVKGEHISRDTTILIAKTGGGRSLANLLALPETYSFSILLPDAGITLLDSSPIQGRYDHSRSLFIMTPNPPGSQGSGETIRCGFAFDIGDNVVFLLIIELSVLTTKEDRTSLGHRIITRFLNNEVNNPGLRQICLQELFHPQSNDDLEALALRKSVFTRNLALPNRSRSNTDRLYVSFKSTKHSQDKIIYIIRLSFICPRSWTSGDLVLA